MKKSDFVAFCERIHLDGECRELFANELCGRCGFPAKFERVYPEMRALMDIEPSESIPKIPEIAEKVGVSPEHLLALSFVRSAFDVLSFYDEKKIPEKIILDTLGELPVTIEIYHRAHGEFSVDLDQMHWLRLHVTGRLFRLGRLQFEMMDFGMDLDFIESDTKVLMTHIPSDSKLSHDACLESYRAAKEFFPKYLGYDFNAFICYSWLMSPTVSEIVGENANITKFQRDFTLFENWPDRNEDAIHFIFKDITPFPQETRLQIAIKKRLDEGLGIGEAFGICFKEKIN